MRHLVRRLLLRTWAPLLAGALLGGCASRPAPQAVRDAAPEAAAPQVVDGTYLGPTRLVQAAVRGCPRSTVRSVVVLDRSFEVLYRATPSVSQRITATIAADDTIHAEDGTGVVDGRRHGDTIDITVASALCQTRMVLTRR